MQFTNKKKWKKQLMDRQERLAFLEKKKNLAKSDIWKEIREIQLNEIVKKSNGIADEQMPRLIGMLQRIHETDGWVKDYENFISVEKKKGAK